MARDAERELLRLLKRRGFDPADVKLFLIIETVSDVILGFFRYQGDYYHAVIGPNGFEKVTKDRGNPWELARERRYERDLRLLDKPNLTLRDIIGDWEPEE